MDESEISLGEAVDRIGTRLSSAVVIAAALIGLAIYARPSPPRYEMVANGAEVLRIDTRKGTILSCTGGHCYTVVKHGQHLERTAPAPPALPKPAAQVAAPQAAPAPAR
jgi:hypothetical protein